MMNRYSLSSLALGILCCGSMNTFGQELNDVKVKAFVDESRTEYQFRLPLDLTTLDNGDVAGFFPELKLQPAFVEPERGPSKAFMLSWERGKVKPSVTKEPYLVYGRSPLTQVATTRFQDHTYLLSIQDRGDDKLGIVRSSLEGAGMTPSPCQELCEMPITVKKSKDDLSMRSWGFSEGLHPRRSKSGDAMLLGMVGNLTQGGKYAPVSLAILNKELHVVWQDALFLGDDQKGTTVVDMTLLNDSTIALLTGRNTKVSDGSMENTTILYLMGPGVMNNINLELDEHYIQDARLKILPNGGLHVVGTTGQKKAKNQRTVGIVSMTINPDLTIASTLHQEEENPSEELELASIDHGGNGTYVVTNNYEIKGVAAGAGGTKLKDAKYYGSSMQVHHIGNDGKFTNTTRIPVGNVGLDPADIIPLTMVFENELFIIFSEPEDHANNRKKGGQIESQEGGEYVLTYIQMNSKGEMYSRPLLKGDDPVRRAYAWHSWQVSETELFALLRRSPGRNLFHMMKVVIEKDDN